jgi:transposase
MTSHSVNEQRIVIKFYINLGKSFSNIREDLQKVYGEAALSKGAISKWMKRFKDGREAIVDDSRVGRPVTLTEEETVAGFQEYILRDRRVSVEHVTDKFAISYNRAQDIMTVRLGMPRVSAR